MIASLSLVSGSQPFVDVLHPVILYSPDLRCIWLCRASPCQPARSPYRRNAGQSPLLHLSNVAC